MKIAFFGTGEFSRNILKSLTLYQNIEVLLVVSQPDKPVGRNKEVIYTPIKQLALENKIDLLQPLKLKNNFEVFEKLKSLDLDFIIVVAYGKIIPKDILKIPKHGCINIHGSLLPKYRGASPIQECLKSGDKKTGLTIMYMSEGMDEGDLLSIKEIDVDIVDKTGDIFRKFEDVGPNLLVETLNGIIDGKIKGTKQDCDCATYCKKIEKEDGLIDFKNLSRNEIYNRFRAYYVWPGIYTYYNGKKLNLEEVSILDDDKYDGQVGQVVKLQNKKVGVLAKDSKILIVDKVKLEGKKSIDILSFINGNKDFLGAIL
ncbi:MAG: methionyl-tRNA formyltransferase [Candidatus Gracilibacteria bacterium]|nr:methionyl-tRNA formyltransferase [Candidatus Gracilibacteria bacterium]